MKKTFHLTILLLFCISTTKAQKTIVAEKDSIKIEITPLGEEINSSFNDYAPVITADGEELFFTSVRPVTEKDIKKGKPVKEMVYYSTFDSNTKKWKTAVPLGENINVPGRNNSNIAISPDGQRLLLYRDDARGNGDIFESYSEGKDWTIPKSIAEVINTEFHESSASISSDGRTIYFVSDRKGGKGGRDIWQVSINSLGKWGKPMNLGRVINTPEDEEAVFIHPDGKTLYFSSKGHKSMGGYDIFKSEFDGENWGKPENMGEPINTAEDDLFFVIAASGKIAYYSSNRGGESKNIYEIKFTPISKEKPKAPQVMILKGVVKDMDSNAPIAASLQISDNNTDTVLASLTSNAASGKYLVAIPAGKSFDITVNAPGYLFHTEKIVLSDTATYQEYTKDILLKKIETGTKMVLKNINFETNKTILTPESKYEINKLVKILEQSNSLEIEISGHTDNVGADEYNVNLSQGRAKSVVEFLVTAGIPKERLTFKGYGKSQPIASNDTEEGRRENRRVEFKIIKK
jgi:outer membrane protein OmpA-like peptidoglycan-associated protein